MIVTKPVRLAVIGAGAIGRKHIEHVAGEACAELTAIVDPSDAGRAVAMAWETAWYPTLAAMIAHDRPEGVIIATPNQVHVANGLEAVGARLPALVEKPLADDAAAAAELVEAGEAAGVPLMTGHHRRHNPLIQQARRTIESGRLGQVVAVHGQCWFHKPDSYFDIPWRREKGAGPLLTNLVHDIDLMRYLCGDVAEVQAMQSNALRGNEVEETAVALLRFTGGALGTVSVSDKIVAPGSWELTSGENPAYSHTQEACYTIGGTLGSLTIPYLDLWFNRTKPSWVEPIEHERLPVEHENPLALQIRNLCGVIRGTAQPVVTAYEGLQTLRVIEAIKKSAATGEKIRL